MKQSSTTSRLAIALAMAGTANAMHEKYLIAGVYPTRSTTARVSLIDSGKGFIVLYWNARLKSDSEYSPRCFHFFQSVSKIDLDQAEIEHLLDLDLRNNDSNWFEQALKIYHRKADSSWSWILMLCIDLHLSTRHTGFELLKRLVGLAGG